MAKKKSTIPSGFEDILGNIYSNTEMGEGITDMDSLMEPSTTLEEIDTEEPPVEKTEDGDTKEPENQDVLETVDDVHQTEPTKEETTVVENVDDNEPTDADKIEAQQVGLLFEAIGNSLGWNMDEISDDDRPLTVDELTEYFTDVVNLNSVPAYADERIQALDEYVKNGGKFEDFYRRQQEAVTLDNIDLEDENNQKTVVREFMRHAGYSEEQINKKITRYEDNDVLYDEAEDALDRLKEIRAREVEEETARQEEYARMQLEQSKAFYDDVTSQIKELTNIRGISIPKEDRKALFDYIFKVDQNGQSLYTKDFNKNLSKNLIESAYFTMKADALISTAKKTGESSATDKLRKILRHSTKNHSTYNIDDKQKSVTDLVSGMF